MSLEPGKPLSRKEAGELARQFVGPLAFVRYTQCSTPEGKPLRTYEICEMLAIADTRTHGTSNRSFREAFHNAGIFWEE